MSLGPVLSQLRRNKLGAVLIAVQMAFTLAILTNAMFIIQQRAALIHSPSGLDEPDIFVIRNQWLQSADGRLPRLETDLATLRRLPGAADAYVTNSYPMSNSGLPHSLYLAANQAHAKTRAAVYRSDDHTLSTLGLRLVAGRNFTPEEIGVATPDEPDEGHLARVIITRSLAENLFPQGSAVGRQVYLDNSHVATIIGVVESLLVPWANSEGGWSGAAREHSMLWPLKDLSTSAVYAVRAQPGQLARVMAAVPQALYAVDPARILGDTYSMADVRQDCFLLDRAFVVMLVVVCGVMLAVTACGIVGLTSYWVAQRRRQIGIRRALGGTRSAIVQHFQTENLLIAICGTLIGAALGVGLNLWTVQAFESARMPVAYVIIGVIALLALGQCAALWPALRAAGVPPALAARSL
jgi:putative ABC transport system permease protein